MPIGSCYFYRHRTIQFYFSKERFRIRVQEIIVLISLSAVAAEPATRGRWVVVGPDSGLGVPGAVSCPDLAGLVAGSEVPDVVVV